MSFSSFVSPSLRWLAPLAALSLLACSDDDPAANGGGGAAAPQSCTSNSQCGTGYVCQLSFDVGPGLTQACDPFEDPACDPTGGAGGTVDPGTGGSGTAGGPPGGGGSSVGTAGSGGQAAPSGKCVATPSGTGGSGQAGAGAGGSGGGAAGSSTTLKQLGDDCTAGSECEGGKCILFTGNDGKEYGFCTRMCTKAEDCPESGWVCNLSPHTACVPGN